MCERAAVGGRQPAGGRRRAAGIWQPAAGGRGRTGELSNCRVDSLGNMAR